MDGKTARLCIAGNLRLRRGRHVALPAAMDRAKKSHLVDSGRVRPHVSRSPVYELSIRPQDRRVAPPIP